MKFSKEILILGRCFCFRSRTNAVFFLCILLLTEIVYVQTTSNWLYSMTLFYKLIYCIWMSLSILPFTMHAHCTLKSTTFLSLCNIKTKNTKLKANKLFFGWNVFLKRKKWYEFNQILTLCFIDRVKHMTPPHYIRIK